MSIALKNAVKQWKGMMHTSLLMLMDVHCVTDTRQTAHIFACVGGILRVSADSDVK